MKHVFDREPSSSCQQLSLPYQNTIENLDYEYLIMKLLKEYF